MNDQPHQPRPFWTFNIGHLLTLLALLGGIAVFLMRYENRISQVENTVTRLVLTVERMDSQGTNASQRGILRDTEANTSNTRRIEGLEAIIRDISPKVERMNSNIEWMMRYMSDGQNQPRKP